MFVRMPLVQLCCELDRVENLVDEVQISGRKIWLVRGANCEAIFLCQQLNLRFYFFFEG